MREGTVCSFADDTIPFAVEGEATVIGGPAVAANPMCAEAGIATALVRSTARPGKIHITASAFGLSSARIELVSRPLAASMLSVAQPPARNAMPARASAISLR